MDIANPIANLNWHLYQYTTPKTIERTMFLRVFARFTKTNSIKLMQVYKYQRIAFI